MQVSQTGKAMKRVTLYLRSMTQPAEVTLLSPLELPTVAKAK